MKRRTAACPQCGNAIDATAANPYRPFCSERCKMADLGQWFAGRYAIPADAEPDAPAADPTDPSDTRQ